MTGNYDFGVLVFLAVVLTAYVIWKPDFLWAILSSLLWGVLLWYNLNNPIAGMDTGSQGSQFLVMVFSVGILTPIIYTMARMRSGRKERFNQMLKEKQESNPHRSYDGKGREKTLGGLSREEYGRRLRYRMNHNNR